jgi:sensor histidine kinase YesM
VGIQTSNDLIIVVTQFIDTIWKGILIIAAIEIVGRYKTEQKNKQLEKEKLEHELAFLKAQINPHFLFNTINSIYVLININPHKAADTLLKFASMLRYQLYDCTGTSIELERELNLISDLIELEKMRKGEHIEVCCSLPDTPSGFRIAPFLLVPVVENAFKHVSDMREGADFIRIKATLEQDIFQLEVVNSCSPGMDGMLRSGGIGLKNMRRRLDLLYPDKHKIEVQQTSGIFKVNLSLYE